MSNWDSCADSTARHQMLHSFTNAVQTYTTLTRLVYVTAYFWASLISKKKNIYIDNVLCVWYEIRVRLNCTWRGFFLRFFRDLANLSQFVIFFLQLFFLLKSFHLARAGADGYCNKCATTASSVLCSDWRFINFS